MTSRDPKGQTRDPIIFEALYLRNCARYRRMVTMDKTMRLSSTVMEVWRFKGNGLTSLTFWDHVT